MIILHAPAENLKNNLRYCFSSGKTNFTLSARVPDEDGVLREAEEKPSLSLFALPYSSCHTRVYSPDDSISTAA